MCANTLLDDVAAKMVCKNDAALSRLLEVAPTVISKMRHNHLKVGATIMLRIHLLAPHLFPIAAIRQILAA